MRFNVLSSLRCVQINLHHSRTAALNLSQLILDLDVDVVLLQEPYAAKSSDGSFYVKYVPTGYSQYHSLDKDHAYGAAVIAKSALGATLCGQGAQNAVAGVRIDSSPAPLYLFSVYCRFSLPSSAALLQSLFDALPVGIRRDSIFAIDCNGKSKLWNSSVTDRKGSEVESLLLSSSLSVANLELSSLDHVPRGTGFVDITVLGDGASVEYWHFPNIPSLSDHPYIMFRAATSRLGCAPAPAPNNLFPNPSRCDMNRFRELLASELEIFPVSHLSGLDTAGGIDSVLELLVDRIRRCAVGAKLKSTSATAPPRMPWWTTELWLLRKALWDAFKVRQEQPTQENCATYRYLKATYQKTLRESKAKSWKDFCSSNLGGDIFNELDKIANPRVSNELPASLLVDGVEHSGPKNVLNQFSNHFFPSEIPDSNEHGQFRESVECRMSANVSSDYSSITQAEVMAQMESLRPTRTAGPDGFSAVWLLGCFGLISEHVRTIFNACLKLGYFPQRWRCAKVLILKKPGRTDYASPGSYRPISILCALSKLFEKIILHRLSTLAEREGWFGGGQHGFRKGRSTESAALTLTSLIEGNRRRRLFSCAAFLDIQSAFDAAWQPAIKDGLLRKGCPLYLVLIISSFLSGRSALLEAIGCSILTLLSLGCPQGSVLSPFLWNILIEAIFGIRFPFECAVIAYADDLVLVAWNRDTSVAVSNLQAMCDALVQWGISVKLKFNARKSALIIFFKKRNLPDLSISINGFTIESTHSCMYLGLLIDSKLNWRLHIEKKFLAASDLGSTFNAAFAVLGGCRGTNSRCYIKLFSFLKSFTAAPSGLRRH